MDFTKEFNVKGTNTNIINDDTEKRIQNMIDEIPGIISMINTFFEPKKKIIEYWGYKLRY